VDLVNETAFVARILRCQRDEAGPVDATLVVKATYEPDDGGRWVPAREQLPLVDDILNTPFGAFHGENFTRKDGVDVCVLGTLRCARPVRSAQVQLSVGALVNELTVFGDRTWVRSGGRLVPSQAQLFEEMPLGYSRAYGGVTVHDYETVTWADNPVGRGYYLSAQGADGHLLPNIEPARGPQVREWSDQPVPAGWGPYPCHWGVRAREGVEPPTRMEAGNMGKLKPRLNNHAHPSLIVPLLPRDAEIRIRGLQPAELVYALPGLDVRLAVQCGEHITWESGAAPDGVFVWSDTGRITLTSRIHFTYAYNRGELRRARLTSAVSTGG